MPPPSTARSSFICHAKQKKTHFGIRTAWNSCNFAHPDPEGGGDRAFGPPFEKLQKYRVS